MSPSYGYTYLTSYGWTGTGTGLRNGAIAKPLAIPPKKSLSGLGKDRDEAFPFWDHLFAAASKAITIKVSSDDEDEDEDADATRDHTDHPSTPLARTTTGILSSRRPVPGTSTSTSGSTTPYPTTDTDADGPNAGVGAAGRHGLSLLATAKREAAKRGLYGRFFRGPVLGPEDDPRRDAASHSVPLSGVASSVSTAVYEHPGDRGDVTVEEMKKSKKRKSGDKLETKEERRERKRLKRERKAAKALVGDTAKGKKDRKARKHRDEVTQSEEDEAPRIRKKVRKQAQKIVAESAGDDLKQSRCTRKRLEGDITSTSDGQQDASHRPPTSMDPTHSLDVVLTTKKKGKRKHILS